MTRVAVFRCPGIIFRYLTRILHPQMALVGLNVRFGEINCLEIVVELRHSERSDNLNELNKWIWH